MWAWPVAIDAVRRRPGGRRQRRRQHGAHVPAGGAGGDGVEGAVEQAQQSRPAPVGRAAACASRRRARAKSCSSASASSSTTTRSARASSYSGVSPAVDERARACDGRNCGNVGFDAASMIDLDRPGAGVDRHGRAPGWTPCTGSPCGVRAPIPRTGSRAVGLEAEVDDRLDAPRRPRRSGTSPRQAEPRRPPRRTPRRRHRERAQRVERRPRLDAHRHAAAVHERQHPLDQLARDALLDEHGGCRAPPEP